MLLAVAHKQASNILCRSVEGSLSADGNVPVHGATIGHM